MDAEAGGDLNEGGQKTAAVVMAGFCAFLGLYAPQPMLPELGRSFHRTPGQISLLISLSTIAVALAAPLIGTLSDRWGRKRLIVLSAILLALPTALAATSTSFTQLLVWRFLAGAFTPGVFALTVTYINEEWTAGSGAVMAAYVSGTVAGGFAGRMLAAYIADYGSWRASFVVLGLLNLLGALLIWRLLPDEQRRVPRTRGVFGTMIGHLGNKPLLATYAAGFCILFSLLGIFTYVNFLLAAQPYCLRPAALGRVFMAYLVGAALTPFSGRLIDRHGQRSAFTAAIAIAICGVLLTLIPSVAAVIAGLAIFCTGIFIAQSSASSFIGKAARGAKASAVGLYVAAYYLGGSFGAAVPGFFWSRYGWSGCVALVAVTQLLTAAIAMSFWRVKLVSSRAFAQARESSIASR
jgi:predicted MFS family arabinose efflux permease